MKSIFPEEMLNVSGGELSLETIASRLTYFHMQLHLNHWQTKSYAEHVCTGSLYDYVYSFKDGVIEKILGYTGKRIGVFKLEPLSTIPSVSVVNDLLNFASQLKQYGEVNKYHDICNLADALSGEAAKTKFLLTLS